MGIHLPLNTRTNSANKKQSSFQNERNSNFARRSHEDLMKSLELKLRVYDKSVDNL